ncbi:MAG: GntR family transcriptional regulator [Pseudolabrys sp.]|jgi:DNA-binding GntR family transcriptional regulator
MPRKSSVAPRLVGLSNAFNRPEADTLDDVYDHIFASIVDQRLPPGTKLNELTLCEIFNVGRRQIGQVLTRLSHDKLITLHANRGAFVAAPNVAEARTIFQARLTIECEIARMVATDATRDLLNPLRKNVEEETAHRMQGRLREAIRSSGAFHILLGNLSGNEILAGIVRQLVARTSLVVSLYENQNTMSCWHDDHGDFIKLLEAHRVQPAVTLMRKHLAHVEESLNFNSQARGAFDLRKIYAPSLRG